MVDRYLPIFSVQENILIHLKLTPDFQVSFKLCLRYRGMSSCMSEHSHNSPTGLDGLSVDGVSSTFTKHTV